MKKIHIMFVVLFAGCFGAHAVTELFNLGFSGDVGAMTADNGPVVPTVVALDTWTKSAVGWSEIAADEVDGTPVGGIYVFNGNVRGISRALSSGLTDGVQYTLSARVRKQYGGGNQRVTIAVTQVNVGTGDYLMDNFYNGTDEAYQPVVANGDAVATNVLQETLALTAAWQDVSGTFVYDAALGTHVVVQLQGYDTGGTSGGIRVDDFILQDPREANSVLSLDPADELAMSVDVADAVVSNQIAASYQVGLSATNVTITSVSIVDQTHPGAFTNMTALPLTLNSPSPASEAISIEFDNTTAGLSAGQVATGVVQIIWKDVSSASSSTSTVPVSATYLEVNPGNTIATWYGENINANLSLQGLQSTRSGGLAPYGGQRSTDGTYGTLSGAPTGGTAWNVSNSDTNLYYAITNNTGSPVTFDSLHFDIGRQYAKGPDAVVVSISGDVTDNPSLTNHIGFTQFPGAAGDYDDFDVDLTGLADRTLAHGEAALITFSFYNGDLSNSNAVSTIDNIALLGQGSDGAVLAKVPGGSLSFGVASADTTLSEIVRLSYTEGDVATNVVITGVTVSNVTHAGAFSASGSFPATLSVPGATNDVFTMEFDNTVAGLTAGEVAGAQVYISWNEAGLGTRVFSFTVEAIRPPDVPESGVVALFHTDFLSPDAALDGIFGTMASGLGVDENMGSNDGDYGTLVSPAAPTNASAWGVDISSPVVTLTITNKSAGEIVLSSLNFDVGRRWVYSLTNFTLSVSGGVTADPALLELTGLPQLTNNLADFEDFDVALTNLADHVLSTGESVVFTFTFEDRADALFVPTLLDNIALMTDQNAFGIWALTKGLTPGVNDAQGDNPDGDGSDNLMEYATNGDPLTADKAASTWQAEELGTNWFYYVYDERTDDPTLTFSVDARGNLTVGAGWSTAGLEFVGESGVSQGFKSVTNRTDMGSIEFIRLKIDR